MSIWYNIDKMISKSYKCGYCGNEIASELGYTARDRFGDIYICHKCNKPTFFDYNEKQTPGTLIGKHFKLNIPSDIKELYNEARKCYSVGAYSAVNMCCRKLLMHIAVDCGAKENLKFIEYVNYLDEENYIPRNSKKWVDIIRSKGNETTHEIKISDEKEAQQLIKFIEVIITLIYEIELEIDKGEDDGV